MSYDLYTDIELKSDFETVKVVKDLIANGWKFIVKGKTYILPLGDKGDFNWETASFSEEKLFSILELKEQREELIGLGLRLDSIEDGGIMLVDKKNKSISFIWNHGRVYNSKKDFDIFIDKLKNTFSKYKLTNSVITCKSNSSGEILIKREDDFSS